MYLTGMKKDAVMLKTLMSNEMRKVGFRRLSAMKHFLQHDKLVELNGRYVINSFLPPFPSRAFDSLGKGIHELADGVYAPVSTYISVTNRCKFSCWHCSKSYRGGRDADTAAMKSLVAAVQDQGVAMVGFTGGEPLLRSDLEDIVASVDSRSASILFTTGDTLTPERAAKLKEAGLFAMAVSLDHWEADEHNRRRGRDDAYDIAMRAIRLSLEQGFYTMMQLVCTREMISDEAFGNYRELARKLGVHEVRVLEPMPAGKLLADEGCACLTSDEREFLKKIHIESNADPDAPKVCSFAQVEDATMYGCGAGFQHMYIDAEGNVCPCDFVPISFGNVFEEDLALIRHRMMTWLGKPRRKCFLFQHAKELHGAFEGKLPISWRDLKFEAKQSDMPDYYVALGAEGRIARGA